MSAIPATETLELQTSDGVALRAELRAPADPVATAVLCHPHPLYGGDMHNNVVGALFDHLAAAGVCVLRFNFRGSGGSGGSHDDGRAERLDIAAAVAEVSGRHPDVPLLLGGYSFGADVSLAVADDRIAGWFAVAPPLRVVDPVDMTAGADPRPKRLATGSEDDFRPPEQAATVTEGWQNCTITPVPGANHFFMVGMDTVRQAASDLLGELTA